MKILMIAECPHNLADIKGGAEAATVNLINGFKKFPVELHVLSIYPNLLKKETIQLSNNIFIHYSPFVMKKIKIAEFFIYGNIKIKKLIKKLNPDVIHLQGTGPMLLFLRGIRKEKLVITQHGIMSEELKYKISFKRKLKFLVKSLYDYLLIPKFNNYISISEYNKKILSNYHKNNKLFFTRTIYNAVNDDFFSVRPPFSFNKIIFVGLVNKLKGVHILIDSIWQLKQKGILFNLDIVGGTKEDEYLEQIKLQIETLGLNKQVHLSGWQNQQGVREKIEQSSIFVLPSLQECLPISIAEAMAAGRVVIATKTGGIPEMFEHGKSGFLFEKGNSSELAEILQSLHNNYDLITSISIEARKTAQEKFRFDSVAEQTIRYYNDMLNKVPRK